MALVKIEVIGDWIRLRWSYHGKRHCLSTGLAATNPSLVVAAKKAATIEGDLITGNFEVLLELPWYTLDID